MLGGLTKIYLSVYFSGSLLCNSAWCGGLAGSLARLGGRPAFRRRFGASALDLGAPWPYSMARPRAISIANSEGFLLGPKATRYSPSTPHKSYLC